MLLSHTNKSYDGSRKSFSASHVRNKKAHSSQEFGADVQGFAKAKGRSLEVSQTGLSLERNSSLSRKARFVSLCFLSLMVCVRFVNTILPLEESSDDFEEPDIPEFIVFEDSTASKVSKSVSEIYSQHQEIMMLSRRVRDMHSKVEEGKKEMNHMNKVLNRCSEATHVLWKRITEKEQMILKLRQKLEMLRAQQDPQQCQYTDMEDSYPRVSLLNGFY